MSKLVEISVIKNFPASCLNRDDTNSPKNVVFGGVERARWSSQSKKYWLRNSELFSELLKEDVKSVRTRKIFDPVLDKLTERGYTQEYFDGVRRILSGFGKKEITDKDMTDFKGTSQILAYSDADIRYIADVLEEMIKDYETVDKFIEKTGDKKEVNKLIGELNKKLDSRGANGISLDLALFGRMAATKSLTNVEASMQVAHAFSTHKVTLESDFFTAIDDLIMEQGDTGSAMMGDVEYNSACYYEYANLDIDKLKFNLKNSEVTEEEILYIIADLVKAFVLTNPGGKQNTFAAHVLPSAILVEIKDRKIQSNYANAFVKSAKVTNDTDLLESSIIKLVKEVDTTDKYFDTGLNKRFWLDTREIATPQNCVVCNSLRELVEGIRTAITEG